MNSACCLRFRIYCDRPCQIQIKAGCIGYSAYAPGGRCFSLSVPYSPRVIITARAGEQTQMACYLFPCARSRSTVDLSFRFVPAAKQRFTLRDATYHLPIDGVLRFTEVSSQ